MRDRRKRAERWWTHYAGSLAFLALLLIAALGFARIENARYEGCEGGNLLRQGLREAEQQQIRTTEATDLTVLFPGVAPSILDQLSEEGIQRSQRLIRVNYADRPCGTKIDLPLTGASIVFPP